MRPEIYSPFFEKNEVLSSSHLTGGRNNRATRVETRSGTYVIKTFLNPITRQSRFDREVRFLTYCKKEAIKSVPEVLQINTEDYSILQAFIDGGKPRKLTSFHFNQASNFILNLNCRNFGPYDFFEATEALFRAEDLFADVSTRLKLQDPKSIEKALGKAATFEINSLVASLFSNASNIASSLNSLIETSLSFKCKKFISPSDFGFHNSIETLETLFFIDFEYSGLDSPVKLILDFLHQPDYFVSRRDAEFFCDQIYQISKIRFEEFASNIRLLFAIKWLLIVLKRVSHKDQSEVSPHEAMNYYQTRVLPLL